MKRRLLSLAFALLPSVLSAQSSAAKPDLYLIHEEIVKPSMLGSYEGATKEILTAMAGVGVDSPMLRFSAFSTPHFEYLYVIHLDGFASLDAMSSAMSSAAAKVGADRWKSMMGRANSAMSSYNEWVVMRRPDLSYVPASPRMKESERRFVRWQFFYLMPGKEPDAEAIARDYVALFKAKNISSSFTIYMGALGSDLPLLIASVPAKSALDFAMAEEKDNAMLGADVRALQARALAITRRLELRDGLVRGDLAYPAPAMPAASK